MNSSMRFYYDLFFVLLINYVAFFSGVLSLRLTRVDVPSSVIMGESVWLNCSFNLEYDELYSIKWYHSNSEFHFNEFYRWLPKENPPGQKFHSQGIYLDLSKSSFGNVFLTRTDIHTNGTFICEVSVEGPSFQTVRKEKELRVYSEESGKTCIRRNDMGNEDIFVCPRLFESREKRFCCGITPQDKHCCDWSKKRAEDNIRDATTSTSAAIVKINQRYPVISVQFQYPDYPLILFLYEYLYLFATIAF